MGKGNSRGMHSCGLHITVVEGWAWPHCDSHPSALFTADDQLYKDIEGALEYIQDGLIAAAAAAAAGGGAGANGSGGGVLNDPTLLQARKPGLRVPACM